MTDHAYGPESGCCSHGIQIGVDCTKCLKAEVEQLKTCSTIEIMCENPSVDSHVREWEGRCLRAEAEVERLRAAMRLLVTATVRLATGLYLSVNENQWPGWVVSDLACARAALRREP